MTNSGGTSMEAQSDSSAAPSQQSPSSPTPKSQASQPINVLAWATFAVIVYAWLIDDRYKSVSVLVPTVALIVNTLPGGMLGEVLRTGVVALVNKLPGKDAK